MAEIKPKYNDFIKKSDDLVTSQSATRAGFVSVALEKNIKATPFINEARALRSIALKVKNPKELLDIAEIEPALLTASGLSDKSLNHLDASDKLSAKKNLIENFLIPAGNDFANELVYRFLLTRGDTLGGMMRNITGLLGEKKLTRAIISALSIRGYSFTYLDKQSKKWLEGSHDDLTIDENVKGLSWAKSKKYRTLIYNITPPFIGKNIDLCLFSSDYKSYTNNNSPDSVHMDAKNYLSLGELKGGIDPAGADEHWKTANTALFRIRDAFKPTKAITFFVGAAIEKSMAEEIFNQLSNNTLSFAANLTNEDQLNNICSWLISL